MAGIARGKLIVGDSGGNPAVIGPGNNGQVLTSDGTDIAFADAAGGPTYTRATSPPGSPTAGDWWYNNSTHLLYIYDGTDGWITDGDGSGGRGFYYSANTFSLLLEGKSATTSAGFGSIYSVRFESEAQMASDNIARENHSFDGTGNMHGGGPCAVSDTSRVVFANINTSATNAFQYLTMLTGAAAAAFGNGASGNHSRGTGISNATRGLFAGGVYSAITAAIDYVTIQSAGNAADFGDLTLARFHQSHDAIANTTRGVICGGQNSSGARVNTMDYVTIANTGNASDFGDLINSREQSATAHSITRGIIFGGMYEIDVIDYITIANTGNASDFGDMIAVDNWQNGWCVHNKLYAYHNRHVTQSKITIATAANAVAFTFSNLGNLGSNEDIGVGKGWIAASG